MAKTDTQPEIRLTVRTALKVCVIPAYIALSILLFFSWVNPSLLGETERHIAADSQNYMAFAESLREGRNDPYVIASLSSFPNTLWGLVIVGLLLKSTVAIMILDYLLLAGSVWFLHKSLHLEIGLFVLLLFANVTTFVSLLSLNKEIFDLFALSMFVYYLVRRKKLVLFAALFVSALCRYETCVIMLLYLALQSRWNLFRRFRGRTLIAVVLLLSVLLSAFAAGAMALRMQEVVMGASTGGLLLLLDNLQLHYLFFVAVLPKILDNMFSELLSASHWANYSIYDPANSYFLFGNNLANLGIVAYLLVKGRLSLRNDLVYFALFTAIFMSLALVIQPRYFYGVYILLCAEAARKQRVLRPVEQLHGVHAVA